jgi:PadR family transcriptional regulator PadR
MNKQRTKPDFLNGVPELLILRLLSRQPMYGYEILQAIRQSSDQTLDFGEGCVYPILHRLEAQRLLLSRREVVNGRSRVVYRVTDKGGKKLAASVTTWEQVVQAVNHVLHGGCHAQPAVS